ncbi:hypothetical protein FIBSPDRAFT_927616 [Athelia psychrophila]|uniref:Uncharacterized protein n=1 Tax=Athelia psychrophila TaxID=1759441 RepID=A0A166RPK2_9AGAM|nr:hypothetical protein FIBSPDRAFT_927616 [Fibularhizoctonia sp. CBS 109695]
MIVDEEDLDKLARQFPDINRLTSRAVLDYCCGLDTILRVVLGQSRDQDQEDGESNGPPWSNLQTIAVAASFTFLNTALLSLVSRLKHTNHPLCRLLISNTAFDDDADEGIMEQLRELVEIEDFTEDWPTPFERGR